MSTNEELKDTISRGQASVEMLIGQQLPATPPNYELFYAYLAGSDPELRSAIDHTIEMRGGRVNSDDARRIREQFLSPDALGRKVNEVAGSAAREIAEIARLIDSTIGNTTRFGVSLKSAVGDLSGTMDVPQIAAVVQRLVAATVEVEQSNRELSEQLTDAKSELDGLRGSLETVRQESLTDGLTGLRNRKCFDQSIEQAIATAAATNEQVALVLVDIDHFKRFNDTHGHQQGDQLLKLFAYVVRENIKKTDVPCRYGGEEFAVILPQTSLDQAKRIAERIRIAVANKGIVSQSTQKSFGRVTLSAGVSAFAPGDTVAALIERADQALYAAKAAGRNRVQTEIRT